MRVRSIVLIFLSMTFLACSAEKPELSVALTSPIRSLHPIPGDHEAHIVVANIYEGLVGYSKRFEIIPLVAASWETPDDVTWIFRLREGVLFHDGTPVTPEDVVASLLFLRDDPDHLLRDHFESIDSVEVLNRRSVIVRTSEPMRALLHLLTGAGIMPAELPAKGVGSGPYRLAARDENITLLKAFKGYWNGEPHMESMTFFVVNPREEVSDILTRPGKFILRDAIRFMEVKHPSLTYRKEPGLSVTYLGFNVTRPPFDNIHLRRAISYGINVERIIEDRFNGNALRVCQVIPHYAFGYNPDLACSFDPERAKLELERGGFTPPVEITVTIPEKGARTMRMIVEDLAGIGIDMKIRFMPWGEIIEKMLSRELDCYFSGQMNSLGSGIFSLEPLFSTDGASNTFAYSNLRVDALFQEASRTGSDIRRLKLIREITEEIHRDVPIVPLYNLYETYAYSKDLEWQPRADALILGKEITIK